MSIGERNIFSWIHLSDLHFGHGDKSYGWDQTKVLSQLTRDIENAINKWPELPRPQAIMITGDIAYSGASLGQDEYKKASKFLKELLKILGLTTEDVFIVPGNHDVQRSVAPELVDRVRQNHSELDQILSKPQERRKLLARQANYGAFAVVFGKRNLVAWKHSIPVPDFGEINLLGLNTALVSNDDKDNGKLVLSGEQQHLLSTAKGKVTFLLTHHPFEGGWLSNESSLRGSAQNHITLHLCGHTHDPQVTLISQAGNAKHHVRVVAAAAHRDAKEVEAAKQSHGYNYGSLMIDAQGALQIRTWPRRWFPNWDSFRVDHLGVPDRAFYDDKILERLRGTGSGLDLEAYERVRLAGVHWWGKPTIRWNELLYGKRALDVFGITMQELFAPPNSGHVKSLLQRGGIVRVLLPDPRSKTAMARYDEDFNTPLGDRLKKVINTLELLEQLRTSLSSSIRKRLEVRVTHYTFKYSAYRIDEDVLFVPYRMIPGRNPAGIPAFVFGASSTVVQQYIKEELDGLIGSSTPVTPGMLKSVKAMMAK